MGSKLSRCLASGNSRSHRYETRNNNGNGAHTHAASGGSLVIALPSPSNGSVTAVPPPRESKARSSRISSPAPAEPRRQYIVALYAYEAQNQDDLSFQKGERMELVMRLDTGWWTAKQGDRAGYVPANYVQIDDERPENSDCYFDVVRRDAERMLLAPFVKEGQFMVRPSSGVESLALSIRAQEEQDLPVVRHYRIRKLDNERGYYISAHLHFSRFSELVNHYKSQADGLCCRLTTPCPRSRPSHLRMRDVEVARRNVSMEREIGRGNFGEVYYGKLNGVIEVAVKQLKNNGQMSNDKFLKEAQIMHKLVHEKIVQLIAVCSTESPILIITEYMPKGSLIEYLRQLAVRPFGSCPSGWNSLSSRFPKHVDMMAQIAMGMAYLEANNFIHRDLRAANILVGEDNLVKVSDFGLAALIDDDQAEYTLQEGAKFPIRWTSPEAMLERRFSIKSDVWSFGVLVYEIVTMGRQPYPDMTNRQVVDAVSGGYRLPNPHNAVTIMCPNVLYDDVMLKCWNAEAEGRPRFERLAELLDSFEVSENEVRYGGESTAAPPRPAPRRRP